MIEIAGLYFPDGEKHFQQFGLGVVDYQRAGREAAFCYVTNWKIALDIGAHVGIFSRHFAEKFEQVLAFEPIVETRECLAKNVPANVKIMPYAVGDMAAKRKMQRVIKSSGGSFISDDDRVVYPAGANISPHRSRDVEMITVDSLGLSDCNLIKLDAQGSEILALKGAERTIRKFRPVVLIEEKAMGDGDNADTNIKTAAQFLIELGATPREKAGLDRVYTF